MGKYSKFWAALMGLSALFAMRHFEVEIMGIDTVVLELVVSALAAAGVYGVRNDA